MEMERAQQVFDSPEFITVTYNGTPVHIDRLFDSSPYAEVSYENGATTNVPVSELKEGGRTQ